MTMVGHRGARTGWAGVVWREGRGGFRSGSGMGTTMRWPVRSCLLAALGAGVLPGCHHGAAPLPRPPANLAISMTEFQIEQQPARLGSGRVVLDVANTGELSHQLTLFRIPDGLPGSLNEQLHSPRRLPASPIAVLPTLESKQRASIALDLEQGRYGLVCFLKGPGATVHALLGMNADVHVR